jgi:hypothetical protein
VPGAGTHKRVLLIGPTGVDKAAAMLRIGDRLKQTLGHQPKYVDFENDFLKPELRSPFTIFLAKDIAEQAVVWNNAWQKFATSLDGEITVLGLHATYISGPLGLRCPINILNICRDFKPTLIISLIDDVFKMWTRTEARAGGLDLKGRPTFEQLLVARRAEQLLGDVILSHTGNSSARHVLCAAGNNIDALINLIIFDAKVTYLSFPISAPRKMMALGDLTFYEMINSAHQLAAKEMSADRHRAFISPLSIDELPLVFKFLKNKKTEEVEENGSEDLGDNEGKKLEFDCEAERWNLTDLWGDKDLAILPSLIGNHEFPFELLEDAVGAIKTDVGWRDRRLVLQSKSLAIICPKPPGEDRITRGVAEEIQTAVPLGIMCNIWQNPDWDRNDFVGNQFPPAGSMGIGQTEAVVRKLSSLEELIRAKPL